MDFVSVEGTTFLNRGYETERARIFCRRTLGRRTVHRKKKC